MHSLSLFNKFYQICEMPQRVDLSQAQTPYTLPADHPCAQAVQEAIPELDTRGPHTKITNFSGPIYTLNANPNWLLRGGRNVFPSSIIQDELGPGSSTTLRVAMNRWLKQVVQEQNLPVVIPEEYLVYAPHDLGRLRNCVCKNHVVISQKLNILDDTCAALRAMPEDEQKRVATTICRLIYHSGFMDAHMANIVLTQDHEIAVIDTEGHGFLCEASEDFSPISFATARIVGLKEFIQRAQFLPDVFTATAKKYLLAAQVMRIVKLATIVLSVLCPLIPLIVWLCSLAAAKWQQRHSAEENRAGENFELQRV